MSSSPSCPTTPLPPRALCRIPLGITKAEPRSFVRRHDPRAPQGAASTDTARRRVLLITTSSCFPPAQSGASHGIMDRKTCRTPPPAPQLFMCGHLGMVPSGWAGDWSTPLPASSPARMPRCWHSPQPGRLADYKGECVISNTQSDFPALLPITKCLVKWLILFSHRNVFPFKSLIRGEEGKKKEKAKLKISSERYHDSNRFTGK